MGESIVQKKVAKLIQQELGNVLTFSRQPVAGTMVTVSVVRVSPDLGMAKVFVTAFPDGKLKEVVKNLNDNNWDYRHLLAQRIRNKVRNIPELNFFMDDSFAEADRMTGLLDNLEIPPESEEDV
ncbi:MAG: 30S ribosome-binding factor RbfA [Bacteroidota bacterium]